MSNGHKVATLGFTVALALAGVVALLWLLGGSQVALAQSGTGVIRVATTGSDTPGCGSPTTPCLTVQYAVDQAQAGVDEIRVAAGTYTNVHVRAGITQVVYISKTVTIRGGYTTTNWTTPYPITQSTTLDAQGQGRVVFITGDISPTIEGLRISDGNAAGLGGDPGGNDAGGGVYVITARTTISSCVVYSNTAEYGGGLYLRSSDTVLSSNTVASNTATSGGGLFLYGSAPTLSGNTVMSNTATWAGGGLYLFFGDATLSGNAVISNTARDSGGGLYLYFYSDAMLSGNAVISNTADFGGGLYLDRYSTATLNGNTVMSNTAWLRGGGLYLDDHSAATLNGNVIMSNIVHGTPPEGGGGGLLLINSTATLSGNTVISNTAYYGGGINLYSSDATLSGDAFISNTAWRGGGLCLVYSDVTLSGNIVMFNTALEGGGGGLALVGGDAALTSTVVTDNQAVSVGSGLRIVASSPHLLHTTIARNSGGDGSGVYVTEDSFGRYGTVVMTNTILVSHSVGISVTGGNTVTVNSILWHGTPITVSQATTATVTVQNQHQGDPLFDADGYHLMAGSAAIDKGVDAGVATDIDGDSRDATPDLGADERARTDIYLPLILKNASP